MRISRNFRKCAAHLPGAGGTRFQGVDWGKGRAVTNDLRLGRELLQDAPA